MLPSRPHRPPRVLIAFDDPVIRDRVMSILADHYNVVSLTDGRDALRTLWSDSDFKGAVFALSLQYFKGPDLVSYMRTENRLMRIPVMIISAERDIRVLASGLAAGATVLLTQPFTDPQLYNALHMMLGTKIDT